MIRSVRFSLTLWYAAILIVILSLFGGVLYTNVRANLVRDVDWLLASEADGVGDAIASFGKAEIEAKNPRISSQDKLTEIYLENAARGEMSALVRRWAEVTEELDTVRPVRIISQKGEALAFSPSLLNWKIPVNAQVLRLASMGGTGPSAFQQLSNPGRKANMPVVACLCHRCGRRCCCVAVVGMHEFVPCTERDAPESLDVKHLFHSAKLQRSPSGGVCGATVGSHGPHVGMANGKKTML